MGFLRSLYSDGFIHKGLSEAPEDDRGSRRSRAPMQPGRQGPPTPTAELSGASVCGNVYAAQKETCQDPSRQIDVVLETLDLQPQITPESRLGWRVAGNAGSPTVPHGISSPAALTQGRKTPAWERHISSIMLAMPITMNRDCPGEVETTVNVTLCFVMKILADVSCSEVQTRLYRNSMPLPAVCYEYVAHMQPGFA